MSCCGQPAARTDGPDPIEIIRSMPAQTFCCMARMICAIANAAAEELGSKLTSKVVDLTDLEMEAMAKKIRLMLLEEIHPLDPTDRLIHTISKTIVRAS